ncbi:hypothetical protein [Candidatus Coxiella mudrowiae]|nr:hypothetical protein [Candidatus Coxiella mudrowiae]
MPCLVLHLLEILKRKKAKRGIAALCIGGGEAEQFYWGGNNYG